MIEQLNRKLEHRDDAVAWLLGRMLRKLEEQHKSRWFKRKPDTRVLMNKRLIFASVNKPLLDLIIEQKLDMSSDENADMFVNKFRCDVNEYIDYFRKQVPYFKS